MNKLNHLAIIPDGNRRWADLENLSNIRDVYNIAMSRIIALAPTA